VAASAFLLVAFVCGAVLGAGVVLWLVVVLAVLAGVVKWERITDALPSESDRTP
jgi:hypothetical protein